MLSPPPAELQVLIDAADLDGLDRYLTSLDPAARTLVRRWFERSGPWFRAKRVTSGFHTSIVGWEVLPWIEAICAVSLLGPASAAKRLPWSDLLWFSGVRQRGEPILRGRLESADPAWAARFAEAANGVSPPPRDRSNGLFARLLRAMVVHHGLPCPTSSAFLEFWLLPASGDEERGKPDIHIAAELTTALRNDPLMPDLLWHYLTSGHCGDVPLLPDALATLVAEGRVERDRLIDTVLAQLTAPPRVASQRVLANILAAVKIQPEEIAGGLDYLLGVIATAHGSVGKVLLPQAIELATDAEELAQLADVVASRPERAQKDLLLRRLRDRGDQPGVIDALQALSAGDDDAAFVAKVQTVIDTRTPAAPAGASVQPPQPPSMGLWDLRPQPAEGREWVAERSDVLRDTWSGLLGREIERADERAWVLTEIMAALSGGDDQVLLAEVATRLLSNDTLPVPRLSQAFEDLFLGGAMSRTWPAALAVADAMCERRPRPARTEMFLRMLVRYADEAPRQELPLQVAGLAATTGRTKAQGEARALGAALSGESLDAYVSRIRAAGAAQAAEQTKERKAS